MLIGPAVPLSIVVLCADFLTRLGRAFSGYLRKMSLPNAAFILCEYSKRFFCLPCFFYEFFILNTRLFKQIRIATEIKFYGMIGFYFPWLINGDLMLYRGFVFPR